MDLTDQADAIAARFVAFGPPTGPNGGNAIREATADPPTTPGMLPAVYVFLVGGELVSGPGTRMGGIEYLVRFLLGESADLARDTRILTRWAEILIDRLKGAVQLGGLVARASIDGFDVGLIPYSGRQYAGVELRVHVVTSEDWGGAVA